MAVLRSPLVGLTINDLARIRIAGRGRFWGALLKWQAQRSAASRQGVREKTEEADARVNRFLDRYGRWRQLARQEALAKCLETILAETHYDSWLLTQAGGEQSCANVQRLARLAEKFDRFQRQGLFRFLHFVAAQKAAETGPDYPGMAGKDAVRLMSIHQSKGLEFPVVVLADLGKPFNFADLHGDLILDEMYGLCPQVKPPQTGQRYPSLPFWLARRRERELLGEELRLLYVAMTRAQDTLILSATLAESRFGRMWKQSALLTTQRLAGARNYADWIGLWFAQQSAGQGIEAPERQNSLLRWFFLEESNLPTGEQAENARGDASEPFYRSDPARWQEVADRVSWRYPHAAATVRPAKTTVSMIRRRYAENRDEESTPLYPAAEPERLFALRGRGEGASALEIGTAHHVFLQLVKLERTGTQPELQAEAQRLVAEESLRRGIPSIGFRSAGGILVVGPRRQNPGIEGVCAAGGRLYRAISEGELAGMTGEPIAGRTAEELVIVQGIADLVVFAPEKIG